MSTVNTNAVENNEIVEAVEEIRCYHCGEIIENPDDIAYRDDDGHVYCSDCVEECQYCGCIVPVDEAIVANNTIRWLDNVVACPDCADSHLHHCRDCGEWFTDDGIWDYLNEDEDEPVCHHCEEEGDYVRCATCNIVMQRDDAYYDEDRDDYFCGSHYHPHTRHLHGYGHNQYSPNRSGSMFLKEDNEHDVKRFFGVELETDKGDDRDAYVDDLYAVSDEERLFTCKTDGSLNNGVELVSRPMSFWYAMESFPWEDIAKCARDNGFRSHDAHTCGLHIHVSRAGLGENEYEQDLTTAKLMIMLDRFWPLVVKFSRRGDGELRQWARQNGIFYDGIDREKEEDVVKNAKSKAIDNGRYQAVNLQNAYTVELRMFRGTLNVNTIRATLQFVQTAIEFVKRTPLKDCVKADWMDFVHSDYEELNDYLKVRGLWFEEKGAHTVNQDSGYDENGKEGSEN